jgi:hypothetical protein
MTLPKNLIDIVGSNSLEPDARIVRQLSEFSEAWQEKG